MRIAVLKPISNCAHKDNINPPPARTNPSILIHVGNKILSVLNNTLFANKIQIRTDKIPQIENTKITYLLGVNTDDNHLCNHDQDDQTKIRRIYKGKNSAHSTIANPFSPYT